MQHIKAILTTVALAFTLHAAAGCVADGDAMPTGQPGDENLEQHLGDEVTPAASTDEASETSRRPTGPAVLDLTISDSQDFAIAGARLELRLSDGRLIHATTDGRGHVKIAE